LQLEKGVNLNVVKNIIDTHIIYYCVHQTTIYPHVLFPSLRGTRKLALKHLRFGMSEMWRAFFISAQVKQLQRFIPTLHTSDCIRWQSRASWRIIVWTWHKTLHISLLKYGVTAGDVFDVLYSLDCLITQMKKSLLQATNIIKNCLSFSSNKKFRQNCNADVIFRVTLHFEY